jgi:hypothetical protein
LCKVKSDVASCLTGKLSVFRSQGGTDPKVATMDRASK